MATTNEARAIIFKGIEEFNKRISGDLNVVEHPLSVPVSDDLKGHSHIVRALLNQDLKGRVAVFTADSRKTPIGLPICMPGGEKLYNSVVALYIPTPKDKELGDVEEIKKRVSQATAHTYGMIKTRGERVNMKGDIGLVTGQELSHWASNLMTPPTIARVDSQFTQEDKRAIRGRNERFFRGLLEKTLQGMAVLGREGILPAHLLDATVPVRKINGAGLAVRVASFVNPDYHKLREVVYRRDEGKCLALNTAVLERLDQQDLIHLGELPVCGESTYDNYHGAVGPLRWELVPETNIAELNHIHTQGDSAVVLAKAIFAGLISPDIYKDPNKLLVFLSCVDVRSMVATRSALFERAPIQKLIRVFVPALQYAIQAVNSLPNLVSVARPCHRGAETGGYHMDMHYPSLVRLIAAINTGKETIPMTEDAFKLWVVKMMDAVLSDTYEFELPPDYEKMESIKLARAIASIVAGTQYVDPVVQKIWSRQIRRKTALFSLEEEYSKARCYRDILDDIEMKGGAVTPDEIDNIIATIERIDKMGGQVSDAFYVHATGITGRGVLKKFGLQPVEGLPRRRKYRKASKVVSKKKKRR